jgi:hypothetical protein
MKNLLFNILLFGLYGATAHANYCNHNILASGGDSKHMTIYASKVLSTGSEMMDEQMALNSANYMNNEFDCNTFLTTENAQVKCTEELMRNHKVCNVETVYGFYLVYKDYVDTVHITFSRWD